MIPAVHKYVYSVNERERQSHRLFNIDYLCLRSKENISLVHYLFYTNYSDMFSKIKSLVSLLILL